MTVSDYAVERRHDGVVLALNGELDISSAAGIERELRRLEAEHPPLLVLDLRGLRFMDSTGLRMILTADARAREAGRRLVLVRGPANVHRVFRITRLDERLELFDEPPE